MNRCGRLMQKEIHNNGNWDAPSYEIESQEGDKQTGFEIIASLPLKEQMDMGNVISLMSTISKETFHSAECFHDAMVVLYTWNGKWEVYNED